ncbi:MAG: DUF433 domain-containing protein [Acidobacteriota bacterium]
MKEFEGRIISDPKICGDKHYIKKTRIPVYLILDLSAGESYEWRKSAYSNLDEERI